MSKYARKADINHAQIRDGLRACGWRVIDVFRFPGMLDLMCVARGRFFWFEVKQEGAKLTPAEERTFEFMADTGLCHVVYSLEDAIVIINRVDNNL